MSVTIDIQGTIISFPNSGESPDWGPALVKFAQSVAGALSGLAGTYDVAPQIYSIASDVNTNVSIPLLSFPTSNVRSAFIYYAIYRTSNTTTESETGLLEVIYNSTAGTWQISREATGNTTQITFSITNTGQVQFSTTAIGGTYSSGTLTYSAKAVLQST